MDDGQGLRLAVNVANRSTRAGNVTADSRGSGMRPEMTEVFVREFLSEAAGGQEIVVVQVVAQEWIVLSEWKARRNPSDIDTARKLALDFQRAESARVA